MSKLYFSAGIPELGKGELLVPCVVDGGFHCWTLAADELRVELSSNVVQHVTRGTRLKHSGGTAGYVGGLLLGQYRGIAPRIFRAIGVEPCTSGNLHLALAILKRRLTASLVGLADNPGFVIGFYRIVGSGETIAFSDLDLELAKQDFAGPENVFLLVEASGAGHSSGRFYFWTSQELQSELAEFPLRDMNPGTIPSTWPEDAQESSIQPDAFDSGLLPNGPLSSAAAWLRLACTRFRLALGLIAMLLVIGVVAYMYRQRTRAPETIDPFGETAITLSEPLLGLNVTPSGEGLRLRWNSAAPVFRSAKYGLMIVMDGGQPIEFALDRKQLIEGNLFYTPLGESVRFTLKVVGDDSVQEDSAFVVIPRNLIGAPVTGNRVAQPAAELPPDPLPSTAYRPLPAGRKLPTAAAAETSPRGAGLKTLRIPVSLGSGPANTRRTIELTEPAPQIGVSFPLPLPHSNAQFSPAPNPPPDPQPIPPPKASAADTTASQTMDPLIPPQTIRLARPVVPAGLKALISQEVLIEVVLTIDAKGRITAAEAARESGALHSSLSRLAVETARLWKFKPARQGNRDVPSEIRIQFQFVPGK